MSLSLLKHFLTFSFLTLFGAISIFGQSNFEIRFSHINTENGLSNNTINAITKDGFGYIWFGTNDGLCRYEASGNVKIYRQGIPEIEGGIESNIIRSLFLDSKKNLWIGTRLGGLTLYNQKDNTWKTFRNEIGNDSSLSNDEILTITEDQKGRIWIGTEDGLNVYSYSTNEIYSFKANSKDPFSLQGKAVLSIVEDDKGWIWAGTWGGGLHLLVPSSDGILANAKFRNFIPSSRNESKHIWSFIQDSKGRYWIGSRGAGLFLMKIPKGVHNFSTSDSWQPQFLNFDYEINDPNSLSNNNIQQVFEDSKQQIWIATVNGLNLMIESDDSAIDAGDKSIEESNVWFYKYVFSPFDLTSISNNDIYTIFEDDQGIYWFGSTSGVSQFNPLANQFEVFDLFDDISKTPNSQNIYIDNNKIAWIGNGENGLVKYDLNKKIDGHLDVDFFTGYNITALHSPDDERLFIGSDKGVSILNMKSNLIEDYPFPEWLKSRFDQFLIRSLLMDKDSNIWVGSEQGLFFISENGEYAATFHDPDKETSLSDDSVNHIYQDSNGDVWVSTFNGLNRLINKNDNHFTFERFKFDPENPEQSIPSNRCLGLEEINGLLYIGNENGLSSYNLVNKSFENLCESENKFSFQSIEKTKEGNLWAGTKEGIVFYNTKTKVFHSYEQKDGLGDVIFQTGSSCQDKEGNFYFGNRRGITKFNPANIKKNTSPPPVFITKVRVMSPKGEKTISGNLSNEIVLNHDEYYLSLDYAALNYNRSERNKYAFMLEGFEKNWNYSDVQSPAIYTNLNHGEYTFRVKAANNDGVWNELGASIKILKKPAIWETWWFQLSGLFLAGLIIVLGVKYYTRSINERNKMLQKYNEDLNAEIIRRELVEKELQKREKNIKKYNLELERSNKDLEQFAYIASHDLQEPLRVVGGFISLLKRRYSKHFDQDAFEYIGFAVDGVKRMSKQIESILTFSKVGKNVILPEPTNLNKIIQLKIHDLSQKIKEKNVKIEVTPMPEVNCEPDQIDMVFYNLISNAIKFNKNENPIIKIAHDAVPSNEFWQFSIKDNGIGIPSEYKKKIFEIFKRLHSREEYEGTGIGLALCKKIIHRHNGEIWFDSKEGVGTTFYFSISKKLKDQKFEQHKDLSELSLENHK